MMRTNSIRKALKFTNIVIILASIVPFIINTLYYNIAMKQYEGIIENVYSANSLASRLKGEIYTTMWNVVTGKTAFRENTQYALIDRIKNNLDQLERKRQQRGQRLPRAGRAQHPRDHGGLRGHDRRQHRPRPARPREREDTGGDHLGERPPLRRLAEIRRGGD
jgi:hypothetical protein